MFYAREQTHLQPEITCYLETDNKKQNEVDQEIFRDKGFIQISSWCFVRAEKHKNWLRVQNPHSRSLESGGRGPPWILNAKIFVYLTSRPEIATVMLKSLKIISRVSFLDFDSPW